jgi:predicted nucleic acid-binding protein
VIVVADTSVLINLCRIRRADILPRLFREVVIPPEVAGEFVTLAGRVPRFAGLALPPWLRQQAPGKLARLIPDLARLGPGESAALVLALEIKADAVLLDERLGHAAAGRLGLKVIGLLGLLLQAKASGLLTAVGPEIDALRNEAGFWISDRLRDKVLQLASEGP